MDTGYVKIYITADKLWSFFIQNRKRCEKEMILIAENTETEYAIYITEECGDAMFSVCKGAGLPEYSEYAFDKDDCEVTAEKLFSKYLLYEESNIPINQSHLTKQEMEDEIYEREDELILALQDFLSVAIDDGYEKSAVTVADLYGQDVVSEILENFLTYLAKEERFEIYRPMFVLCDGAEVYTEYPYNEFDDAEDTGDDESL